MTGDQSPHVDATVVFNGRLQPNKCTWMKFQDSAMILEEQPAKVHISYLNLVDVWWAFFWIPFLQKI